MTKAKKILWGAAGTCVALFPALLLAHFDGPDVRHTGAPGDDALSCASIGCHTASSKGGPINFYGGSVTATFSSGTTYTPGGSPITITVTASDPANSHFGFQMTARLESNLKGGQAGTFTPGMNQRVLCDDDNFRPASGCAASVPVEFIEHYFTDYHSVNTTSAPYTFTWTPPSTDVGNVHFYVAGNVVNYNGTNDGGDHVYTNSYVLTPAAGCTLSAPVITNVISASAFGAMNTFAPGSWLEVYGTNLAPDTRQWAGTDFNGSNAPASIDGVSVSIDNKPGFIYYIKTDPNSQINVQAPADTSVGPVAVTVTNCGGTSAPYVINESKLAPGVLAPPSFNVGGKQYMVAEFADGTYVGNANLIPGVPFRPAKPGDTIIAYGIGFGQVTPSFSPGVIVNAENRLTNPLTILFGQTPAAPPAYLGLAAPYVGLYQFNLTVPNVPNGDVPVTFTVGGVQTTQTMYLTVHN